MNKNINRILPAIALIVGLVAISVLAIGAGQKITGNDLLLHYYSSSSGAPIYEGAVQVDNVTRRVASLYAASSSGSTVYLKVQDTANAGSDNGPCVFVIPISANSFVSIGGAPQFKAFTNGIYLAPFTDSACTSSAGSVLFYSVDYQ